MSEFSMFFALKPQKYRQKCQEIRCRNAKGIEWEAKEY